MNPDSKLTVHMPDLVHIKVLKLSRIRGSALIQVTVGDDRLPPKWLRPNDAIQHDVYFKGDVI